MKLQKGIQQFLNGVSPHQISELIERYDINGDGKISFEEFLDLMRSRSDSAAPPRRQSTSRPASASSIRSNKDTYNKTDPKSRHHDWEDGSASVHSDADIITPMYPRNVKKTARGERMILQDLEDEELSQSQQDNETESEVRSQASSAMDVSNPRELQYRLKIFLQNLKAFLLKRASDLNKSRSITTSPASSDMQESSQRLSRTTVQQQERVAASILSKMFAPYSAVGAKIGTPRDLDPTSSDNCVEFNDFAR